MVNCVYVLGSKKATNIGVNLVLISYKVCILDESYLKNVYRNLIFTAEKERRQAEERDSGGGLDLSENGKCLFIFY